ncbi:FadR/GntR family transcriptional regulator [Roseivivax sp. CAU 1753]
MPRATPQTLAADLARLIDRIAPDVGDRLPPERALARQIGCSRESLRKGLAALEASGEIWRHVGQGAFRGQRPRHLPIRDTVLVEGATPPDLMQARILLEPMVAAEAARCADAADVAHLRARVEAGRDARDRAACEQADDAFHRAIAQATRNPVLIGFLDYLSGARRRVAWQRQWDRTYRRIGVTEFRSFHSDQHDRVVAAIAGADAEAAATAMARHLETIAAAISDGGA